MILEGRTLAAQIRQPLPQRAEVARQKLGRPICLRAIGSTEDYGAYVYLKKEVAAAQELGVDTKVFEVDNQTPAAEFLALVKNLSADKNVDAILIPRPLPAHLAATPYADLLAPQKDIDGMSNINAGNFIIHIVFGACFSDGITPINNEWKCSVFLCYQWKYLTFECSVKYFISVEYFLDDLADVE